MEEIVGALLCDKSLWLAVAESCTGGIISARITNMAGSSRYFKGAVVAYSNEVKRELLSLSPGMLDRFGAVSPETAAGMAQGVRGRIGADIGLSVTGIAGPTGGTEEKPVGTVFIAVCDAKQVTTHDLHFTGDRETVRARSAEKALEALRDFLQALGG
ncbi:MAG: CinA family protein [Thermodesulfobacteriota bacterium]